MRNKGTKWENSGKVQRRQEPRVRTSSQNPRRPSDACARDSRETDPVAGKPKPPSPGSEQCSRPLTLLLSPRALLAMLSCVFPRTTHF